MKGKIISHFGKVHNKDLNTITENVGIDILAKNSNKVVSILDGVVTTITYIRGHGNVIIISHGEGFNTVYAKIDQINVNENDYVQSGKIIGSLDKSNKKILHFEIWGNQKKLNPEKWIRMK